VLCSIVSPISPRRLPASRLPSARQDSCVTSGSAQCCCGQLIQPRRQRPAYPGAARGRTGCPPAPPTPGAPALRSGEDRPGKTLPYAAAAAGAATSNLLRAGCVAQMPRPGKECSHCQPAQVAGPPARPALRAQGTARRTHRTPFPPFGLRGRCGSALGSLDFRAGGWVGRTWGPANEGRWNLRRGEGRRRPVPLLFPLAPATPKKARGPLSPAIGVQVRHGASRETPREPRASCPHSAPVSAGLCLRDLSLTSRHFGGSQSPTEGATPGFKKKKKEEGGTVQLYSWGSLVLSQFLARTLLW
jgi:hypothetical protein